MATGFLSVTSFGAKGNGSADDQAALQNAFNAARASGQAVYIPPGTYLHSSTLRADGITVFGSGEATVLKATNPANASIFLTGSNPGLFDVKIDGSASARGVINEMNGVTIDHATGFTVENVHVYNSMAAGIMNWGGSKGYIGHNYVEQSRADAIHNTAGAHDVTVEWNKIYHAGDDGVAVVSYSPAPGSMVYNITVQHNTVKDSVWGRGLTVVGGQNVQILSNHVDGSAGHAGVYIAAEKEYNTAGVHGVVIKGNTLVNAGGAASGHGAITIYNSQAGVQSIDGVNISDNQIVKPLASGILTTGKGAVSAAISGTDVYSDTNAPVLQTANPAAGISQSDNVLMKLGAYPGAFASPGGGVDTSVSYLSGTLIPGPDSSAAVPSVPVSTPAPVPITSTPAPVPVTPAPTGSTPSGAVDPTNKLTLHVSGDQWNGAPALTVLVDGKPVGGQYYITASHNAGQWQDIVIPGVSDPSRVQLSFSNDSWGGTDATDRNVYVGWIDANGHKILGTNATINTASLGATLTDAAVMKTNGTITFDYPPQNAPVVAKTAAAPVAADPAHSDQLVLHVSGDHWNGNPEFSVVVDGKQVGGLYQVTASHGAGQWQDIVIPGVTNAHEVQIKFANDAYGGSSATDRNIYIDSIEVNGTKIDGTDFSSTTASQGKIAADSAIMLQNGLTTFKVQGAITGTAQSEFINGDKDQSISGGGGHDIFVYRSMAQAGGHITDFHPDGPNQSKLDLGSLLQSLNYHGTDPVADKFVNFVAAPGGATAVNIDPDGAGPAHAITLVTLDHVDPAHMTATDYFWS